MKWRTNCGCLPMSLVEVQCEVHLTLSTHLSCIPVHVTSEWKHLKLQIRQCLWSFPSCHWLSDSVLLVMHSSVHKSLQNKVVTEMATVTDHLFQSTTLRNAHSNLCKQSLHKRMGLHQAERLLYPLQFMVNT